MTLLGAAFTALLAFSPLALGLSSTLEQVDDFGDNPTNVGMYYYKPGNVTENPALIVAIHYCTGSGTAYFEGTPYAQLADEYGFIVIYPSSPNEGTCWDVSSFETLKHGAGGDSYGIANMVGYAKTEWGVDPARVFVTGTSSGAMMTNVLAAAYPDLFAAGIVYSGVAAGCFMSSTGGVDAWNSTCSTGESTATPEQWANVVYDMYPDYTGEYPRMQECHGTADDALEYPNFAEEVKQWAGVFGYDAENPEQTLEDTPLEGYTKFVYGDRLQGISAEGVGHTVPVQGEEDLKWFGII